MGRVDRILDNWFGESPDQSENERARLKSLYEPLRKIERELEAAIAAQPQAQPPQECSDCRGTGQRLLPGTLDDTDDCPSCEGTGVAQPPAQSQACEPVAREWWLTIGNTAVCAHANEADAIRQVEQCRGRVECVRVQEATHPPAPSPASAQPPTRGNCVYCNSANPTIRDKCPYDHGASGGDSAASSQRALVEALQAMVDRWEPDCIGTDRIMWENAVAALDAAGRGEG